MARPTGRPIRDELIETATQVIQRVGVNGFSYGDLAKELDIKAPSIHHHFRTKEDLIAAVVVHYRKHFAERVAAIDHPTAAERLQAYAELFAAGAASDDLCLCGAVSADWLTVGEQSRAEVHRFFEDQQRWIEKQLADGVNEGDVRADIPVADLAATVLAALEGSMLMSRAGGSNDLASTAGALLTTMVRP